ncbi:MAG TPA: hypothetical protein VFU89_04485 [Rhabdochlamydiaceae bacterium]|nr:hypothetical protein [Rhabdochlamydiaceae bacterium]
MATGLNKSAERCQTTPKSDSLLDVSQTQDTGGTPLTAKVARASIDSASKAFERMKASRSYGIAHIYYGVILPLKEKIIGHLNESQRSNLELYRAHTALCAQVDKVKSVYKAYRTAQKTADNAPLEPAIQRKGARQKAQAAGDELVKQYDQLIELAIKQAETNGFSKKEKDYLDDIRDELSKDTKDHILQTVNQLRARKPVEDPMVDSKMNENYTKFVVDFVSQVHVANQKSGGCENLQKISSAFIEGLASIPELEGLALIDLYDELNNEEIQKRQFKDTVKDFSTQLKALMNKDEDVTDEELRSIHSHGVALSSVSSLTAADLNKLKNAKKQRLEAEKALAMANDELVENQEVIRDRTNCSCTSYRGIEVEKDYSLNDIEEFLKEIGKNVEDLPDEAKKKGTVGYNLVNAINAERKCINVLSENLKALKKERSEQDEFDKKTIKQLKDTIDRATKEIAALDKHIRWYEELLVTIKNNVDSLDTEYKLAKDAVLNNNRAMPRLIKSNAFEHLKQNYQTEHAEIIEEMNERGEQLRNLKKDRKIQQAILDQAKADFSAFSKKAEDNARDARLEIKRREKNIESRKTGPMIRLFGAEVAEIGRELKVGDLSSATSKMAVTYLNVMTAYEKAQELSEETIPAHRKNIELQDEILKDGSLMSMRADGTFVVSDKLFGEGEIKQNIEAQISSNLGIAKGVTLAVAKEVIRQEDAYVESQKQPKTKISARQQQIEKRASPLQTRLEGRKLKSDPSIFSEIEKRVKVLSATVNPAPASISDDQITSEMGGDLDKSDADSASNMNKTSTEGPTQDFLVLLEEDSDVDSDQDDTLVIKDEL